MKDKVYDMHVGVYFLLHVVVLVFDVYGNSTFTVSLVHLCGTFLHDRVLCMKVSLPHNGFLC